MLPRHFRALVDRKYVGGPVSRCVRLCNYTNASHQINCIKDFLEDSKYPLMGKPILVANVYIDFLFSFIQTIISKEDVTYLSSQLSIQRTYLAKSDKLQPKTQ